MTILVLATALTGTASVEASAATTYTPTGGPSVSLVGVGISLTDVEVAQTFGCSQFDVSGSVTNSGTSRAYGADAFVLPSSTLSSCNNALGGSCVVTPIGTWTLAVTGDATGGAWPARLKNVKMKVTCTNCQFTIEGVVNGKLQPSPTWSSPRFTPNTGASGLTISGSPAPTGSMCVTLDVQAGDTVAVGGYWRVVLPLGTSLTISNP